MNASSSVSSAVRPLAVCAVLVASFLLEPFPSAAASDCESRTIVGDTCSEAPVVQSDGYVYDFDGSVLRRGRPGSLERVRDEGSPVVYEFAYSPACWANTPPDVDGRFDTGVGDCAVTRMGVWCPVGELAMWSFRRVVAPPRAVAADPAGGGWSRQGVRCVGATESWSVGELTAVAREYLEERVAAPVARVQPPGGGLVGVPVLVHTRAQPPVELAVSEPVPGRLVAAVEYWWEFGEPGAVGRGAGRAYDGTSPIRGEPGYYVSHTYESTGPRVITLRAVWSAAFTVAGLTVGLEPIVFTDTVPIGVRGARSVLVAEPAG